MPIFKGPSLKTRAVSKNIRRYGERMKTIPFYKYMLLFFREKNNPILYPISSQYDNLKVTEGKDSQRSLKQMSKVRLFQEVVEGRTDILNKSIQICSPKQGGNYSKFNPKYTEDFLYHLFYFQFHLYCQKKPGLVVAAENWKKRKYAREKYYTLDQTIM